MVGDKLLTMNSEEIDDDKFVKTVGYISEAQKLRNMAE